jgi:hypothetical protein
MTSFEAALAALVPAQSRIDRDAVMFRAGQAAAAAHSGRRVWMAVAASLGLVALGEAAVIARGAATSAERIKVVRAPEQFHAAPPVETQSAAPSSESIGEPMPALGRTEYERLVGQVLRYGLDGLPASRPDALAHSEPRPAPTRERLRDEFRKALESGDAS